MASIEPSQCFICIRTPMAGGGFKKIQNINFIIVFRYIVLMFWGIKVAAQLVQLPRILVNAFTCKQYKLLNSH